MKKRREESLSKFMSLLLRHNPKKFNLVLSKDGSCTVKHLLRVINEQARWNDITYENIIQVARNCPKQRYTLFGDRIKANYGHSILQVELESSTPPDILYHGTNMNVLASIIKEGIKPMNRNYVHLSESEDFATLAGKRKGELVIMEVDSKQASLDGINFYYAGNEVWLSDFIDSKYLKVLVTQNN